MKKKNKVLVLVLLALCLVATTVFGTIAWLTATDNLVNTFTVGKVNYPETDPDGSEHPGLNKYMEEPSYVDNQELLPGGNYAKDPYVGIGKGSDESFVYVYVKTDFNSSATYNHVYFTLNDSWEAVDNRATAGSATGSYVKGLFKYKGTLKPTETADAWTSEPIFDEIVVAPETTTAELNAAFNSEAGRRGQITVYGYIHQAKDGHGESLAETAHNDALNWADTIIAGN